MLKIASCEAVIRSSDADADRPCRHPARYLVRREFSGLTTAVCGIHRPSRSGVALGILVTPIPGQAPKHREKKVLADLAAVPVDAPASARLPGLE